MVAALVHSCDNPSSGIKTDPPVPRRVVSRAADPGFHSDGSYCFPSSRSASTRFARNRPTWIFATGDRVATEISAAERTEHDVQRTTRLDRRKELALVRACDRPGADAGNYCCLLLRKPVSAARLVQAVKLQRMPIGNGRMHEVLVGVAHADAPHHRNRRQVGDRGE